MRSRLSQEEEGIRFWPCTYAEGHRLGEKAYNDGHTWEYADKIGDRFSQSVRLRWVAFNCGLSEGYDEAKELHEARQQEPVEC